MILLSQLNTVQSNCSHLELCTCDRNEVICDANYGNQTEHSNFSLLTSLPSVDSYYFRNFNEIPAHAFQNLTFLSDHAITIHLINVTVIRSNAFSTSMIIPDKSTISINIERSTNSSSIILQSNAFNGIKMNSLRLFNINNFNGRPIFDTNCFGENLQIDQLIFEQSGITGFSTTVQKSTTVKYLRIHACPAFTQLTSKSLPSFLSTTESLEISNTGLQLINAHTFQSESRVLKELIIRDNSNFKVFSSNIVDGVLKNLEKLDLSNNPIDALVENYDWSAYSYAKHLVLKQQQIDLFLKTKILNTLKDLRVIDISEGFIREDNEDFVQNYFPNMPHLLSLNVSNTNLTENMIVNLLGRLSKSINQTLTISLLGHTLNDRDFCLFYKIFQKTSNLLQLELDETHECNCIVGLFYNDKNESIAVDVTLKKPICLLNNTRTRCDTQSQSIISKCPIDKPNPSGPGAKGIDGLVGALIGVGVAILVILIAFGSAIAYRRRRVDRRLTLIDMEEPIENPLAVIMEQRSHVSH
ncbi:unnamed protein product [Rotaria socialis]|uniref:Uncharacterized protein n=1 Tax=Rotaria socialis TaxID=392032 RepID=A0A821FQK0_9BILA|nr:unnamed protein product [Rotaria socialis]CAF4654031.1 unnamed protein product [Rotaria socialis]